MLNKLSWTFFKWWINPIKIVHNFLYNFFFIKTSFLSRLLKKLITLFFYLGKFRLRRGSIILADSFYSLNESCHLLILEYYLIDLEMVSFFNKFDILILFIKDFIMLLKYFFLFLSLLCINKFLILWILFGFVWLAIGNYNRIFSCRIH